MAELSRKEAHYASTNMSRMRTFDGKATKGPHAGVALSGGTSCATRSMRAPASKDSGVSRGRVSTQAGPHDRTVTNSEPDGPIPSEMVTIARQANSLPDGQHLLKMTL